MYNLRWLNEEDYSQLVDWWKSYDWTPPSQNILPDNGKCGLMVNKNGINICAGFIYFTNSDIAWIEFIISNKAYKKNDKKTALRELIQALTGVCESQGAKVVFTSLKSKSLIKLFKEEGYQTGDTNVTQLIKTL